ncbi:ABC transporter substrate-binding protein [Microbacterium sp. 179-I 3D3 NHS]|uniref:ABC transporter substrate-binding protein n=1 Tax=Microbacterium sp. 179-I 3D3 NHS TaxID=3142382 RepID=UPI0039A3A5A6
MFRKQILIRAAFVLVGALSVGSLAACGSDSSPEEGAPAKVRFGVPTNLGINHTPLGAAIGLGYFEEEGLDVELVITGEEGIQGVATGQIDIGTFTPDRIYQVIEQGGPQSDLVMVYNYLRGPTASIAVLDESPIRELEDFAGATFGASDVASANLLISDAIVGTVGLKYPEDIGHLGVGIGPAALQALVGGEVDALSLWDTEYAAIEAQGIKLRYFSVPEQEALFSTTAFTTTEYKEQNPEIIEAFGRAVARATLFTITNPEAALGVMYETFPELRQAGVSEEEQLEVDLIALNARLKLLELEDGMQWGEYNPDNVEMWMEFGADNGIIPAAIEDWESTFTNEFVDAYNDFDPAVVEKQAQTAGAE